MVRLWIGVVVCGLAVVSAFPAPEESEPVTDGVDRVYRFLQGCGEKDMMLCIKMRALTFVDRALRRPEDIALMDGVKLVRGGDVSRELNGRALSEAELDASLPKDAEDREATVETMLVDRVARFLESHTLQLKVPDASISDMRKSLDEARGKKKKAAKILLPLLLLLKLKAAALIPLALGALALLALKALIVGKLALVLAGLIGLQKLLGQKGHTQSYEVVAHPHYTEEHGHGWGRSANDAHDLAYRAYKEPGKQE